MTELLAGADPGTENFRKLTERMNELNAQLREARANLRALRGDAGGATGSAQLGGIKATARRPEPMLSRLEGVRLPPPDLAVAARGIADAEFRAAERQSVETAARLADLRREALALADLDLRLDESLERAARAGNDLGEAFTNLELALRSVGQQGAAALADVTLEARSASDAVTGLLNSLARVGLQQAFSRGISAGLDSLFANADGNAFDRGNVVPFAHGGILGQPTFFRMNRGLGVAGEAGPEAVMPLRRTAGGKLGVLAQGGGGVSVNITNNGDPVDVSESRFDGRNLDIVLECKVRDVLGSGAADGELERFGVRRRPL